MRVPHNSYVLVADGKKMLFFRNEGDERFPRLEVDRKEVQKNPPTRDQKTDESGRTFASAGTAHHAYSESDFHQLGEDRFAVEAADMLRERALRNDYETLIVVAPPRTLGELRKHYHKEVERRLTGEVAKDLTGHPVTEIEKILRSQ